MQQQKQTIASVLPELFDRVEWLTELPTEFSGVVIANEVLDAIPAKRLIFSDGRFVELGVDFIDGNFQWKPFDEPYSNSLIFTTCKCVMRVTLQKSTCRL